MARHSRGVRSGGIETSETALRCDCGDLLRIRGIALRARRNSRLAVTSATRTTPHIVCLIPYKTRVVQAISRYSPESFQHSSHEQDSKVAGGGNAVCRVPTDGC